MIVLSALIMVAGLAFLGLGAVGLFRFPDYYTRMHAAGKCDTLGTLLIVTGFALFNLSHHGLFEHGALKWGVLLGSLKIVVIAVFLFLTSPTATHAIARAAFKNRMPLWTKDKK